MSFLNALWLGLVQGLTEFLPVSSSGHLVFAKKFLGVKLPGIAMEAVLHLGTLAAVLVYYRADLTRIARRFVAAHAAAPRNGGLASVWADADARLGYLLVVGTLPAAVVGLLFKAQVEALFESLLESGVELFVNGVILMAAARLPPGARGMRQIGVADALWIGAGQALGILPAISRSGSTVSAALWRRLDRPAAVRFSFLLSVPAIAGAAALEAPEIARAAGASAGPLLFGFAVAAVSGYLAIAAFTRLVIRGRLHWFAWYCFAVGAAVTALALAANR